MEPSVVTVINAKTKEATRKTTSLPCGHAGIRIFLPLLPTFPVLLIQSAGLLETRDLPSPI